MSFEAFVESLSVRLGLSRTSARQLVLGVRDELLVQVAAGNSVPLPGLGSLNSVTRGPRICASNLPGRRQRVSVGQRMRLRFAVYPSVHKQVEELRGQMAKGQFGLHGSKRRVRMPDKKKKQRGKTVEVSIPPDVTEITIKIEKDTKKSESKGKKRLLG